MTPDIYESLLFKIHFLELDEFDKKERKFLNFGHTFGHALEISSSYKLSHGYAVAIGCLIALKISQYLFQYDKSNFETAQDIVKKILSHTVEVQKEWFDFDILMECVKSDKKNDGNLNMVLIKDDKPILQRIEDYSIINQALEEIYEAIRLCN
jgi:3-dehydroquinate synthase